MKAEQLCYWKWRKVHKHGLAQRVDFIVCGIYGGHYACAGLNTKCDYYRPVNIKDKEHAVRDRIMAKSVI